MNLARVPVSSTDLILQAETELLTSIARLLAQGSVASADWKIDRLRRLGALNEEALRIIGRYRDAILHGIDAELERKAFEGLRAQEKLFQTAADDGALFKGVLPFDADPALEAVVQTWQKEGRLGLSKSMAAMLQNCGQVYVDTVNRTSLQVLTGGMSAREALVTTVKEWAAAGIPSITDLAGRQWSTEAYASMVLRSTSARVVADTQLTRAQQYGADLIEVSSHLGARPGCAPYQARILSISGTSEKYPALSSTSYGQPDGLFGINCGHRQYPFFEGISRKTYEPYDSEENDAAYKQSQVQRSIERAIRAAKREVQMLDAIGDKGGSAQARERIAAYQGAMRRFIDRTGRTRRRDREQIYTKSEPSPLVNRPAPGAPGGPGRSKSIVGLQERLSGLSDLISSTTGATYAARGPVSVAVQAIVDRGKASILGRIVLCKEVARSIDDVLSSGVVDETKDLSGPYNQAVNFRTLVHEHMHLHGKAWDGAKLSNKRYVSMLETVNDLSAVYVTKDYATELGLRWNVAESTEIRSPGYSYNTTTFERIFRLAGKSDAEIRSLVLKAKAELEIDGYEAFFKASTGRKFRWSFSTMLENSAEGRIYLRKFEELMKK